MKENQKKAAIVTGASSGIGKAIAEMLVSLGYEVFGFGREFTTDATTEDFADNISEGRWASEKTDGAFHPIVCDLLDTEALEKHIKQIRKQYEIYILVNNAGVGYYGLHEELNAAKIKQMVRTNLELPLILSNLLLRDLKKSKGYLLQVSSVTALKNSPHGCAYGATKAGLTAFSRSLFEEARKYGVKVTVIHPDMTQTNLYRNADFTAAEDLQASLCPEDVAGAVRSVLTARDGMVIPELTLSPQLHRISKKKPQ